MRKKFTAALLVLLLLVINVTSVRGNVAVEPAELWSDGDGKDSLDYFYDDEEFSLQSIYPKDPALLYTYDQLRADIAALERDNPELVTVNVLGKSVDNRDLWSVTVGNGSQNILVVGALHAREWVTTPVLMQTIKGYIADYDANRRIQGEPVRHILQEYSITFVPMANPDGVTLAQFGVGPFRSSLRTSLLSMNPAGDNFQRWKANIRGVDLNRNFNVQWNQVVHPPSPGPEGYRGPQPESEPEIQAISGWVRSNNPRVILDYHSNGEVLFWYYYQTGSVLERDQRIVQALSSYSGYWPENINTSKGPNTTFSRWGVMTQGIPSIVVEVGRPPSHELNMNHVPHILNQTRNMSLISILNLPDYSPYVAVQSVSLPGEINTVRGATEHLQATVRPANASNQKVSWSTNNPQVATVRQNGEVTVHAEGSAIITVTSESGNRKASTVINAYPPMERISGTNRYATAAMVSQAGWDSAENIVLARGDDFADGLAGVPLAYQLNAPILLSTPTRLSVHTKAEIIRLSPSTVYILGGDAAVPVDVENVLIDELGLEVVRIAGTNRFDTAVQIAAMLDPAEKAVVVNAHNFPDALSVAPYAASQGYPILLTRRSELHEKTALYLQQSEVSETYVIGGSAAVGDEVAAQLPAAKRISGSDRYTTAIEVTNFFNPDGSNYYLTTGLNYADALTGAVLAAQNETGILLTSNRLRLSLREYLSAKEEINLIILGGAAAVPYQVEGSIRKLFVE